MRTLLAVLLCLLFLAPSARAVCPVQTASSFGNGLREEVTDASLDPSGRLVVCGTFHSWDLLFPGLLPVRASGGGDAFLALYDASGNPEWAKGFGDQFTQSGLAVATDTDGNIAFAGLFTGSINLGGATLTAGGYNVFLAKFNSSGDQLWSKTIGTGTNVEFVYGIATAPNNDIIVLTERVGSFTQGLGIRDIYVARYDQGGTLLWSDMYGTKEYDDPGDVAVTAAGNIILAGSFGDSATIGSFTTPHAGSHDVFVAEIDPAGTVQWVTSWGGSNGDRPSAVTVAPDGSIYFGGEFKSPDAPGLTGGPFQGHPDWFIGKLDSNGNLEWIRNGGTNMRDRIRGLDTNAAGDVVATGGLGLDDSGDGSVFVCSYSSSNAELFDISFSDGVGGEDRGVGIEVDANGDMLVVGQYEGILDLCSTTLSSAGDLEGFVLRMSVPVPVAAPAIPTEAALAQNHPNPFNPSTMIRYRLAEPGLVTLDVFDTAGRRIRRLVEGVRPAGASVIEWDGRGQAGEEVASGVYYYRIETAEFFETRRMVLVR